MTEMQDLKEKISRAARDLFRKHGISGVSMRKIAGRVGVSATAIYRHYEDKDELLNEMARSGLEALEGYLENALAADDPYQRLLALTEAYLDFALEQPDYFDLAFRLPLSEIADLPEEIEKKSFGTFGLALQQLSLCMDNGTLRRDDPIATAILVWSTIHGLITLYRMNRLAMDESGFRQLYGVTVRRLYRGLSVVT